MPLLHAGAEKKNTFYLHGHIQCHFTFTQYVFFLSCTFKIIPVPWIRPSETSPCVAQTRFRCVYAPRPEQVNQGKAFSSRGLANFR